MADESSKNEECISHPFAVEDRPSGSAFSVVHKGGRNQFATAKSRHQQTIGSIQVDADNTINQTNRSSFIEYSSRNLNTNPLRTNTVVNKTSDHTICETEQARSAFCENSSAESLRNDAIGPGLLWNNSKFYSSRTQNSSSRTNLPGVSSERLRHRGRRPINMPPQNIVPNSNDDNSTNSSSQNCQSSNREIRNGRHGTVVTRRNRKRLNNDLELLSRPSWCDAGFAYEQVVNGKASGNKGALWFRSRLHHILFRLGCFIQRRAGFILVPCLMVLIACAIGLRLGTLETKVENLWVETGGKLEEELAYTRKVVKEGTEATFQILIQTGEDTATVESLLLHLEAARAATQVTVTAYNQDWGISDLCHKEMPDFGELSPLFKIFIEKVFPCFIMGPLDCFYEGAELLGPDTPVTGISYRGINLPTFTWKNLNPKEVLENLSLIFPDVAKFNELVVNAGVHDGYQTKWCLNPNNPECPEKAPNKENKQIPDVKALINKGCEGYATKFMKWPNDLIVGGIERDKYENITRARGLQTLIQLMGPTNMYNFYKDDFKTSGTKWTLEKATNILTLWQRKFVEEMYKVKINKSTFHSKPDEIHAFAPSTAQDLILEFSNFSFLRVAAGYLFMLLYACFTMLRCKASRSQGAVGVVGVLLVALSVMAGLGICSVVGIKFNAATTQVLPFLMLGLGVDDMFLIAHHFGEIACSSYIPFEERTGECLKRVGVSVLLTSIAILSGFLFAMVIPMPALRSFALQAAIITCFNLFCVLLVFPATLSIDLQRRRKNKLDIFCCFQSSSANDVVELTEFNHEVTPPKEPSQPTVRFTAAPPQSQTGNTETEATITMHHTIQAFSNESYITFLGPAAETTFASTNPTANAPGPSNLPQYYPPLTPPPQYTPDGKSQTPATPPTGIPKQAFQEQTPTATTPTSTSNQKIVHTRSATPRSNPASANTPSSSNLVTPMVSVRSSTHSLVPASRSRAHKWFCWGKKTRKDSDYDAGCLPCLTLTDFAKKYYGPFLVKTPVRIIVLALCALLVGGSIYGCLQVRDGLELVDILPRDTKEHNALSAQLEYFSFYNMYIVTKDFDYAYKQKELHMLHQNISQLKYVVKNTDGSMTNFWLEYMRDWLMSLQNAFDNDWTLGFINETTWKPGTSKEGKLAFKLLLQTGKFEKTTDFGRIGCSYLNKKPCERVSNVRLVSDDGIIREDAFYNYLTAWTQNDPLAYVASLAQLVPTPETWPLQDDERNYIIPRSEAITYGQMPYYLNGLRENDDFVTVINSVRALCDYYEAQDIRTYPSGYPFLFWQQYIDLRQWLFIAMGAAIVAISAVVALVLLNPWAAGITGFFLIMITTELLGFMGVAGIKLSAVPAVILVAAIGLGVEFTVHITLAFITSCGSREDRVKAAISHMMGPVIDGAVSTFLGVVMLSGSEFDFIVRYFFQVLAVLVLIGLWNGIVVLPVILSYLGPSPEVVPIGGGNRLKTPTPPPTPPIEEDERICRHNCNNSNSRYNRYQHECCQHYSSRDDVSYMQRSYGYQDPYYHDGRPCFSTAHSRYPHQPAFYAPGQQFQYQINPGYSHPHSVGSSGTSTPRGIAMDRGRVMIYPASDFVVYSADPRATEHARTQHCDSPVRAYSRHDNPISSRRLPGENSNPQTDEGSQGSSGGSGDPRHPGKHIATLTSSVTVKVHPRRQQRLPVYLAPSSNIVNHSSSESSTFYPIPEPSIIESDQVLQPCFSEKPRNTPKYSKSSSSAIPVNEQNSESTDEASEAVDTAFRNLGKDDVIG